jgi:hypothetical protein
MCIVHKNRVEFGFRRSSTRKAIFSAYFGKEFGGRPGAAGDYIFRATADTFYGFLVIVALSLQGCG